MTKPLLLTSISAVLCSAAQVDIYSAKEIKETGTSLVSKGAPFASKELKRYGNHYTMIAQREQTGSSELHEHEADFFFVQSGEATLVSGGTIVNPKTEKTGEIRGTSIEGGDRRQISVGDVIHIPAGVPHQLLVDKGKPFTYFVVKVTGQ